MRNPKMTSPINKDNIELFAHTNEELLEGGKPKSILVEFHGLGGGTAMIKEQWPLAHKCAEHDVLYVLPYSGPWSWMNKFAIRFVDEVMDAIFDRFDLPEDTPIISSGYSMGGYSALVYTRYSKRTPAACAALCPVCDFAFHYTERDDIPRTIYLAYMGYDMPFEEAIKSASPVELCDTMPDIPYAIYHGTADIEVRKDRHSDVFVAKMRALGRDVRYTEMEGLGHCAMTGVAEGEYHEFVTSFGK